MPIPEFFEREGEQEFRRREAELVVRVLGEGHEAVSLGGGAVLSREVREALRDHVVVWLRVPLAELWRRAEGSERPLAAGAMSSSGSTPSASRSTASSPTRPCSPPTPAPRRSARCGSSQAPRATAPDLGRGELRPVPGLDRPRARSARRRAPTAERWFCITDTSVAGLFGDQVGIAGPPIEVEPGEGSKTFELAGEVLRELADRGVTRSDCIVALGGGVVGDFAGFCAAVYQRGVPVVQVPTTLVAQVDSAYGGKTGVDLPEAKNYIGAYHQPASVIADTDGAADAARRRSSRAGFVEVVKTALLAGGSAWERVRAIERPGDDRRSTSSSSTARCTSSRSSPPTSATPGVRATLNLGHTVGHAIEAAGGYERYRHGEAVGLGLLAALRLSGRRRAARRGRRAARAATACRPRSTPASTPTRCSRRSRRDKKATRAAASASSCCRAPGEPLTGQRVDPDSVRAAVEELRGMKNRVAVMHGVNLDQLGGRDPEHYGTFTLARARGQGPPLGRASSTSRRSSSRPTTRASSSSTCTGCRSSPTRAIVNAGRLDALQLGDPRRARGRRPARRSRSTSPTSTRARTGAATRSSRGWSLGRDLRQGRRGLPRGARDPRAPSSRS